MKKINNYFKSFNGSENHLDYLKYGLFNDRGYNFEANLKVYNEEEVTKSKCNLTKHNNIR